MSESELLPLGVDPQEPGRYQRCIDMNGDISVEHEFELVERKGKLWYVNEQQGIAAPMWLIAHEGRRYRRVG